MKKKIVILLGSLSFIFGKSFTQPVTPATNDNIIEEVATNRTHIAAGNLRFEGAKLPSEAQTESGFDFTGMILSGIKSGGVSLLSAIGSKVGTMAFNAILTSMGIDVRSDTDKKLDAISNQLNALQQSLQQGIIDVKRKITHLHNEDLMNKLYDMLTPLQTPVASKMAALISLGHKEISGYDAAKLKEEKETFLKGLGELKFEKLSGNNLWNETENLAKAIMSPSTVNKSMALFNLYEDIYGANETWDYATIAPRTQFIGYVGSLLNSLAQLAQLKAAYDMSQLKDGDSNLLDYQVGIKNMLTAVNEANGYFKSELEKLAAIQKKHDEQHLITHRDVSVDKDGNLNIKDGITISTRIIATTTADNDSNYLIYKHNEKNHVVEMKYTDQMLYSNFVYTLDCTQMKNLYAAVLDEYASYNAAASAKVSMQDYLLKVGFSCEEKDLFAKAKGFYSYIDDREYKGSRDNWWSTELCNDLRVHYYNFADGKEAISTFSTADTFKNGWFASNKYSGRTTDAINDSYLLFLNADQTTLEGKVVSTITGKVTSDTAHGYAYNNHFKGHRDYCGEQVKIK